MSFLDDLFDIGKSAVTYLSGNSLGSALARTAVLGLVVNKLSNSANKDNSPGTTTTPDPGDRIQVKPSVDNKIPVLYGKGFVPGIISYAEMSEDRQTMWYAVTISEKTGTKLSDGLSSSYIFHDVYWNDQRIVFRDSDHATVNYAIDRDGNVDTSLKDRVKIYFYAGNSTSYVVPENYTLVDAPNAYDIIPGWTTSHQMNDLLFAVIQINYASGQGANQLGNLIFEITNSMSMPGDVMLDYMTSTRYGAGIPQSEIFDE